MSSIVTRPEAAWFWMNAINSVAKHNHDLRDDYSVTSAKLF